MDNQFKIHLSTEIQYLKGVGPKRGKFLNSIVIESKEGFAYSIELLIKAKKQNLRVIEIPSIWIERIDRKSSFKIFKWSVAYLKWYFYAFFI